MKSQLKKIGVGVLLAMLPLMANTASAQWTQQQQPTSVVVNLGDSAVAMESEVPAIAKSIHTVALTPNGTLMGQVATLDPNTKSAAGSKGITVFFVRDGRVVHQAEARADGSFEIQGLTEGAYSFFAAGNAGFAASGVYVTRRNWGDANNRLDATIASSNYRGIQQLLQRNVPVEVRQAMVETRQTDFTGPAVTSNNQIRLINGRLNGQINSLFGNRQPISGIQIHLIQDNQPIAQVETNAMGEFSIPDVEPGVYDFVAANSNSMVVERFEAVGNTGVMTQVSFRKTNPKLEFALTESRTTEPPGAANGESGFIEPVAVVNPGTPIEFAGESVGFGGASGSNNGGFTRGGRFGGRGVGLRRLLLLGAAGGIIGGTVGNPNPASPVQ